MAAFGGRSRLCCGALVALVLFAPRIVLAASQDWQPTQAQAETVIRLAAEYMAAKDRGAYRQAYALTAPAYQAVVSYARFTDGATAFNDVAGAVIERRIIDITWYDNAPDAEYPGIYAAVDFVGRFADIDRYCGYLMFNLTASGAFLITLESQTYMDRETERGIREEHSEQAVETAWAAVAKNCP